MLFKSNLLAQASGSLDGTVWSHNAGGRYTRNRAIPTNPATSFQTDVRNSLGSLASAWSSLTGPQRDGWGVYAANVPLVNRLGDSINLSGLSMYIRSNAPRLTFMGATNRVDTAPSDFTLPSILEPVVEITTPSALSVTAGVQTPVLGVSAPLLVFASRPQNKSINFFKGPYRFAGVVTGSAAASLTLPFPALTTNNVFLRFRRCTTDGRLSTSFFVKATVGS